MSKRAPRTRTGLNRKLISFAVASCFAAEIAHANPTGPSVAAGSASFNTAGSSLTVTNSPNAIINWRGFSIGAGEITRFQQQSASSAVLNRVVGQDPSAILGTLWSNGKVFLVNPNGILFGQGSRIDVGGLVASTLNMNDRDFLAGKLNFQAGAVANSIVNQGEIRSASGGNIYLVAPDVTNSGLISSPKGEVILAAGKSVSLVDIQTPNLKVEVAASDGEARNLGQIVADSGRIGVYAGLINQQGTVRADTVEVGKSGEILFRASKDVTLTTGSITSASGAAGGVHDGGTARVLSEGTIDMQAGASLRAEGGTAGGKGGLLELSGKGRMQLAGTYSARALAPGYLSGSIVLDPENVDIFNGVCTVDLCIDPATGLTGGNIVVTATGDLRVLTPIATANVDPGSSLQMDASNNLTVSAAIGSIGTRFDHDLTLRAGNNVVVNNDIYLASRTLTLAANVNALDLTRTVGGSPVPGNTLAGDVILAPIGAPLVVDTLGTLNVTGVNFTMQGGGVSAGNGDNFDRSVTVTANAINVNVTGDITIAGGDFLTAYATGAGSNTATATSNATLSAATSVSLTAGGSITIRGGNNDSESAAAKARDGNNLATVNANATVRSTGGAVSLSAPGGSLVIAGGSDGRAVAGLDATVPGPLTGNNHATANADVLVSAATSLTISNTSTVTIRGGNNARASAWKWAPAGGAVISGTQTADASANATLQAGTTLTLSPGTLTLSGQRARATASESAGGVIGSTMTGTNTATANSNVSLTGGTGLAINVGSGSVHINMGSAIASAFKSLSSGSGNAATGTNAATANSKITLKPTTGNLTVDAGSLSISNAGNGASAKAYGSVTGSAAQLHTLGGANNATANLTTLLDAAAGNMTLTITPGGLTVSGSSAKASAFKTATGTNIALGGNHTANADSTITLNASGTLNIAASGAGGIALNAGSIGAIALTQDTPNGNTLSGVNSADAKASLKLTAANVILNLSNTGANFSPTDGPVSATGTGATAASKAELVATSSISVSSDSIDITDGHLSTGAAGTVTLAPFTASRNIQIESSGSAGVLSLTPLELARVDAGTVQIGSSIGTGILNVNTPLTNASLHANAGTLRLYWGDVYWNAGNDLGTSGAPFSRHVEIMGNNNFELTNSTLYLAGGKNLTIQGGMTVGGGHINIGSAITPGGGISAGGNVLIDGQGSGSNVTLYSSITSTALAASSVQLNAGNTIDVPTGADITAGSSPVQVTLNSDRDASGAGRISLGSGTVITSNGGNVTLGGGANPLTANAFGDGPSGIAQFGVLLRGATISSGTGNISIRGTGAPGTTNATGVQLDTGSVLQSTSGSITVNGTGGNGTLGGRNRGIFIVDTGTQVTSVDGTITLTGQGGNSTGFAAGPIDGRNRGIDIIDGPVISTSGTGNIFLTGTGGSSVDQGQNTGVLLSQATAIGTRITTVNGNIAITGNGGSTTGASAVSTANRGVSIGAAEVRSTGSGSVSITGTGGTTNNNSGNSSNSGVLIQGDDVVGIQAFVTTAGGNLSVTGTAGSSTAAGTQEGIIVSNRATVQSGGSGTLTLTGTSVAGSPAISLSGGGGVVAPMTVHVEAGGTLNVTANGGLLKLATLGGSLNNEFVELVSNGNQTINAGGIVLAAGASGTGAYAEIGTNGSQNITVGASGISLTGGSGTAANSQALIFASGTQNITVNGGGDVTLTGGSGSGNTNFARISAAGTGQTITFNSGGDLILTGGTVGNLNFADIQATNATVGAQTQTITGATGIMLSGGASGGGLDGSNNSLGNFARIQNSNGLQNIAVGAGGVTITGGGGPLTSNFAGIFQGATAGSPGTSQTLTINNGGSIVLQGGSSAQTNVINNPGNLFRGSYAMIQGNGDSQLIDFTNGGALNLTGGTVGSNNPAQIFSRFGLQTIAGAPAIALTGGASGGYVDLALNKNEGNFARINGNVGQSITASSITLTGGAAGVGNHAQIFDAGTTATQSINATAISLTGGAGGGIDSGPTGNAMGNFALIQGSATQTITATGMSLHGGAGGQENFATVTAPTQAITVHGDLSLTGGGSVTGTVRGGGARIGGPGGSAPGPTNLTLIVDGNLAMTGGSQPNSGTAIGNGTVGAQPTAMEIDVGGNMTLNPGTVANAGSRIGSSASNMAGGDISITAGGTLALNSTGPGLGTAIRTLGNLTLNAASITQGADSEIISGGTTTLGGGTVSLPSATNQFGTVLLNTTGNVDITDLDAIVLGTSTTGSGSLTVTAPGGITQSGPITTGMATFHAGASPIVLTNAGNDFTGSVDLDTSSSAQITDANSFIIRGGGGGGPNPTSLTINANGTVSQSAAFTGSAPALVTINAGSGDILLNDPGNSFSGNTTLAAMTTGSVSLANNDAGGVNLGASSAGALTLTSGGPVTQSGPLNVSGASTINAGSNAITLTNVSNDFGGAVNFTGSNVSLTDVNAISIGNSSASGALNIVATSTSFLNGFSANNYSFSGGTYTLAAGTYNLGGTTSIAQNPVTAALTVVAMATGATINTSGGTVTVGVGGTLSGTGTIQGNVNNVAGTVSPGASPGMLTITGNYTQGASGTLAMDIGGLTAGTQYDQLVVGGSTSLAGTLNTALINGFVPLPGSSFILIQGTGPLSGTFNTINQPAGALFNNFYGPTTFEFVAAGGGNAVPAPIAPTFNYTVSTTEQLSQPLIELIDTIVVTYIVPAVTVTPEGKIVPKPPSCN